MKDLWLNLTKKQIIMIIILVLFSLSSWVWMYKDAKRMNEESRVEQKRENNEN